MKKKSLNVKKQSLILCTCISFLKKDIDSAMYRGCLSDPKSKARKLCTTHEKECYKCNTTDCNYLQSFQLNNPIATYKYPAKQPSDPNFEGHESDSAHFTSFCGLTTIMGVLFTLWI